MKSIDPLAGNNDIFGQVYDHLYQKYLFWFISFIRVGSVNPFHHIAIDVLKDVSVHCFWLHIISGIFGGPAFNLSTAVVQNGDTYLTIGLFFSPKISSASSLSNSNSYRRECNYSIYLCSFNS